jgi:isoleucyl-tRNA synthetase
MLTWNEGSGREESQENGDYENGEKGERRTMASSSWSVINTSDYLDHSLEKAWLPVSHLREKVQYALEVARKEKKAVGSSLDAKIVLVAPWSDEKTARSELEVFGGLANIFVVSQVSFVDSIEDAADSSGAASGGDSSSIFAQETMQLALNSGRTVDVVIRVIAPGGEKCPRCWKYAKSVFGQKDVVKPSCGCEL